MIASLNVYPGLHRLEYGMHRSGKPTVTIQTDCARMKVFCGDRSEALNLMTLLENMGAEHSTGFGPGRGICIHPDKIRKHASRNSIEFVTEENGVEQTFEIEFLD